MAQELIDKIRAAAQAKGIDPEVALGIARAESGLDPNAKAKSSTAAGLFQILNNTWSGNKGAPGKQFDPDENIRVGTDIISKNVQSLRSYLGRDPSPKEVYAAHYFGASGARDFLSAAPDTPTSKIFSEKVLAANPNLKNKTAAQVLAQLEGKLKIPASNVSRETKQAQTEPTPAEEVMTKALPAGTTASVSRETMMKGMPDIKAMPASYQAAFALAALADAQDEEDDKAYNENKGTETEAFFASYKPVNHLASLDLSVQPIQMADGGDVTARQDEPFFDAASRTFVDVMTGRRTPITEKDFTAREQLAMMDAVKRSQARGGKGRVDYEDYPSGKDIGPGYVDIRNTLGGFQYKQMPDGSTVISDRYDFHGPRVAEYEKMGTGEKLVKSAKNALIEFVDKGFSPRDLAGELGRAYIGSKGPEVNIRIPPVKRADGSPEEGEMSKPYIGNPNIRKQGEAARKLAAMRDVNTLPDPKTYAAVSGLLGTPPDEMGFSVMHPKAAEIKAVAEPAFAAGTALQIAPALQMMGVGKAAGKTGEAAKMLARDFQQYNQQLDVPGASYAIRNRGTPFIMQGPHVNFEGKELRPAMSEVDDYVDRLERNYGKGKNPALGEWLKSKVGSYLRRDFGTEQDQMVQAADQGKRLHFMSPKFLENQQPYISDEIGLSREMEGFPKAGFAKTPQGQKVEEVVDSAIYPLQLQDISLERNIPPSMKQFVDTNPEMRLSQFGPIDENLKFDDLAIEMNKMMKEKEFKAYGETVPMPKEYILTEDTLKGLTPAQASTRVANRLEWMDKKRGELAGVAIAKDPQIVSHSYDNGSKWISPADLADHPNHAEMVKDIGCAGGWCTDKDTFAMDYGSGENRLNILLDKKFEPRVQLTVNSPPTTVREFILANPDLPQIDEMTRNRTITSREVDRIIKAMPEYLDFVKQNEGVKRITEIKGQFNNADLRDSPYLKQVQDFVKRQGPDLLSVHNLEGINMVDARVELAKKNTEDYMKKFKNGYLDKLRELNGNSFYVDQGELPELLKKTDDYMPSNAARAIQMNLFQTKATGGMIERQPTDNRRYL